MIAALNKHFAKLTVKLAPQIQAAQAKWKTLQPREQQLLAGLGVFMVLFFIFMSASSLLSYHDRLSKNINSLNQFTLYSKQAANIYKQVSKVEANTFNAVNLEQIKGDVAQILQIKDPDILIQDGQMTISVPNAEFSQIMALLEQFRRSYAIFPSQVTITRQSRTGYVSFNATFWVKQQ